MADETEIAVAVMRVAANQANGVATFPRAKREIPNLINLSRQNLAGSTTRNGEPMWHQLLRNIKSHYRDDTNFIYLGYLQHVPGIGYSITKKGAAYLKANGF
jgi:hypothetical protein